MTLKLTTTQDRTLSIISTSPSGMDFREILTLSNSIDRHLLSTTLTELLNMGAIRVAVAQDRNLLYQVR